jgi:hypothetical protein
MTNRLCVLITGASGAGKDTIAALLGLPVVKFSSPAKRAFEVMMDIPYGTMDDREARNQKVPHPVTGGLQYHSYLDVMIRAYHVWDSISPGLSLPQVKKEMLKHPIYCVTDMRKEIEMDLIESMYGDGRRPYSPLIHIRATGRGNVLESDDNLNESMRRFKTHLVDNSKDLEHLSRQLSHIIQEISQLTYENTLSYNVSVK